MLMYFIDVFIFVLVNKPPQDVFTYMYPLLIVGLVSVSFFLLLFSFFGGWGWGGVLLLLIFIYFLIKNIYIGVLFHIHFSTWTIFFFNYIVK